MHVCNIASIHVSIYPAFQLHILQTGDDRRRKVRSFYLTADNSAEGAVSKTISHSCLADLSEAVFAHCIASRTMTIS